MDMRYICASICIIHLVSCAPVLNDEEVKDKRGMQTTKEAFELEQTLKRLAGEDKKFFPQPGSRPMPQVDGLDDQNQAQDLTKDDDSSENDAPSDEIDEDSIPDITEDESPEESSVEDETASQELSEEGNNVDDAKPDENDNYNGEDEDELSEETNAIEDDEDDEKVNDEVGDDTEEELSDEQNGVNNDDEEEESNEDFEDRDEFGNENTQPGNAYANYRDYYQDYSPYRFQVPSRRSEDPYGYGTQYGGAFGELPEDEREDANDEEDDDEEYLLQDIMDIVRDHPELLSKITKAQDEIDQEEPITDDEVEDNESDEETDLKNIGSQSSNIVEQTRSMPASHSGSVSNEDTEEDYLNRLQSEQDYNDRMNEIRAEILRQANLDRSLYGGAEGRNEYYQDFRGDETAHVVAKKMGYEKRDEAVNDELIAERMNVIKRSGMMEGRNIMM